MKKIFILLTASMLSGCALIDAYLMQYDPNEYQQIANIRTSASLAKLKCDDFQESKKNASIIADKTFAFVQFAQYVPRNEPVKKASVELDKIAQGLKDQYQKSDKVSATFCKIKFGNIESSAEMIQRTVGDKPR
jgi:hypothetical protein